MSRELRICPGVESRKCVTFLSTLDRDPHPTCTRCRERVCTKDMACDICADWSAAQWEQFVKKRSYKERKKHSRPSGSVPPAPLASSRAETPSGVSQPGTSSSSFSRPSGGQEKGEGSQGAPGVVSREASSPPAGPRSSDSGGSVSGLSSVARERAPSSPAPSGAGEGELLGRSGLPLPAPLPRLSLPVPRRMLDDVGNWERLRRTAPMCYPLVVPDLRIEEHGRIRELVHGQVVLVTVAVVLALAPLPVRGQEVESFGGGHRRGCSLPVCGRVEISRGLRTATALDAYALVLGETGLDPRIDTGLARTALGVTGRVLRTATDHVDSVRVPQLAGEVAVTRSPESIS